MTDINTNVLVFIIVFFSLHWEWGRGISDWKILWEIDLILSIKENASNIYFKRNKFNKTRNADNLTIVTEYGC